MKKKLLILALIAIALVSCGETAGAPTTTTGTTPTAQATQAPTAAPKWTTVQTVTGNGSKKTAIFTAPSDWKILWSCKGDNIGGTAVDGVLVVTVYGSDNTPVDVAVNATCKGTATATTGETEEHQGGSVYLDVNGTGDWTLQVQELK
jgi:hypothetical protein